MFRLGVAAVVAASVFSNLAQGQPRPVGSPIAGPSMRGPSYSPYLNLLRRDAPPGVNYYGLVRPQITTRSNLQAIQQQLAAGQQQPQQFVGQPVVDPTLPITGQPTYFLNTGGYFLNSQAGLGPNNSSFLSTSNRRIIGPQQTTGRRR